MLFFSRTTTVTSFVCSTRYAFALDFAYNTVYIFPDSTKDILLVENSEVVSQLESLRDIVNAEKVRKKKQNTVPIMERSSAENVYVNMYTSPEYFWEKSFPTLYPYGRGGPSDPFFDVKDMQTYFAHVLRRGGGKDGRRFQNNPGHMFVSYTYEIKRRVKNMAYAATRDDTVDTTKCLTSQAVVSTLVDCLSQSIDDDTLDIEELYKRTKQKRAQVPETSETSSSNDMNSSTTNSNSDVATGTPVVHDSSIADTCEDVVNDEEVLKQVKRLMQRLVPFAEHTPGTPMHMNFERLNMLAMITSTYIVSFAQWRWFTTYSFPDKQDSRIYENVFPMANDVIDWIEREEIVRHYSSGTRAKLLRDHPALVARIFHEKQECIWNYVVMGSDHPIGYVLDYMRRVEVWCNMFLFFMCVFLSVHFLCAYF